MLSLVVAAQVLLAPSVPESTHLLVASPGPPRQVEVRPLEFPLANKRTEPTNLLPGDLTCTTPCDLALAPGAFLLRTRGAHSPSTSDRLTLTPPGLSVQIHPSRLALRRAAVVTAILGAAALVAGLVTVAVSFAESPQHASFNPSGITTAGAGGVPTPTGVYVGGSIAAAGLLALPAAVLMWSFGRDAVVTNPIASPSP